MEGVKFYPYTTKSVWGGGGHEIKCSHAEGDSLDSGHLDFRHSEGWMPKGLCCLK